MVSTGMVAVLLALGGLSVILSLIAIGVGIAAFIELRTFNKSTHKVEYYNPFAEGIDKDFKESVAQNEDLITKVSKEYNDQLKNEKSEFADFEDDFESVGR